MHTHKQKQKKLGLDILTIGRPPEFFFTQGRVAGKPESFLGEAATEANTKLIFYFQFGQDNIDSFLPAPFS